MIQQLAVIRKSSFVLVQQLHIIDKCHRQSSTTSVASSIYHYRTEHGRTYHGMP